MDSQSARGDNLARGSPGIVIERDREADRGVEPELADGAAERHGAVHRAAIGIEHHQRAVQVAPLRETGKSRARYRR